MGTRKTCKGGANSPFLEMTETEQKIFNLIYKEGEITIDQICRELDIPISKLSSLLLQMEFRGLVKCCPGIFTGAE